MAESTASAQAGSAHGMSIFETWQKAGLGVVSPVCPDWYRHMAELNAEIVRFTSQRMRENLETQTELMQCHDPAEFSRIQGEFLKTAFDQYSAETGKLVQMNQAVLDSVMGRGTD